MREWASGREHPNRRSAAGLRSRTAPLEVLPMTSPWNAASKMWRVLWMFLRLSPDPALPCSRRAPSRCPETALFPLFRYEDECATYALW